MARDELFNSDNISTIFKYDTPLCADSVEWCPHNPCKNFFVCGNYELKDETKKRVGCILLFCFKEDDGLKLQQTVETAAVLDQKWCHCKINDRILLGVATAEGQLQIYELIEQKLKLITSYTVEDENDLLLLSLDWSTGKYSSDEPQIVCSDSKGNCQVFRFINNQLILSETCGAHDYEAWISAFYYWDQNIIFTGGDDCLLFKFDLRVGKVPVLKNRSHNAGVTSLHSNCNKEFVLASGSYDCYVRLWDIRNMKAPSNEIEMPGTLWRLKFDPFECRWLLAACMLGGAHVIDTVNLKTVTSYHEHKNITYGSDWSHLSAEGSKILGTCSFYDRLLCISKLYLDANE